MLYEDSAMFIAVEDNYETNFVFKQTAQMWRWLCLSRPTVYFIFVYQNSLSAAGCCCRTDYVSQWSGQCVQRFFKNELHFSRWKLKRQMMVLHIRCGNRL